VVGSNKSGVIFFSARNRCCTRNLNANASKKYKNYLKSFYFKNRPTGPKYIYLLLTHQLTHCAALRRSFGISPLTIG
jgi:hypothetical protein